MKGPPETLHLDKPPEHVIQEPSDRIEIAPPDDQVLQGARAEEEKDVESEEDLLESYSWMANSEEFDQQVLEEIEQEEYMEQCFRAMWKEEEEATFYPPMQNNDGNSHAEYNGNSLGNGFHHLAVAESANTPQEGVPLPVILNPNAAEYIPRSDSES